MRIDLCGGKQQAIVAFKCAGPVAGKTPSKKKEKAAELAREAVREKGLKAGAALGSELKLVGVVIDPETRTVCTLRTPSSHCDTACIDV
jgi:hypothetical protein